MKYTAAVITVSDKCSRGEREDTSGPVVKQMLEEAVIGALAHGMDMLYADGSTDHRHHGHGWDTAGEKVSLCGSEADREARP